MMNGQEILYKYKIGEPIDDIANQLFKINKKQYADYKQKAINEHELRRIAFEEQGQTIKSCKEYNKKYKFTGEKIIVGKLRLPEKPTYYNAKKVVEQIIYDDWMVQYGKKN